MIILIINYHYYHRNIKTEMFADFKSLYTRISTMVGEAAAGGSEEKSGELSN